MDREITRRDFLNGAAIGVSGSLLSSRVRPEDLLVAGALDDFAPEKAPDYYPPALMGMRGNHEGTYTFAHRLRDGEAPDSFGTAIDIVEHYDLVVVGGGISGLAAAYFFRKNAGKGARILIFDNHDDFGGHAKRNWASFAKLNVHHIVAPGSFHTYTGLDFPVSLGQYHVPSNPEEPIVLFLLRTPCKPGLSQRDQNRAGRYELLQTPFSKFESKIRDQLARMLGGTGFDPAKDVEGITVNRWAHGHAFTPNSLFDPDWKEEEKPWVIGRQPFGRITIANADAGANAYTNEAIDQAHRAVDELLHS